MRYLLLPAILFSLLLTACTSMNNAADHKAGICSTLKSQLIFGGNTNNTRLSNIQNAEQPMAQYSYDKNNC